MRDFFKKIAPSKDRVRRYLGNTRLARRIYDPRLWHFTHRTVANGIAIGLFCAFIPLPVQIPCAVFMSLCVRANLPMSVLCSLISNPLTMPAIYYFSYRFGSVLLGRVPQDIDFSFSWDFFTHILSVVWQPLLLGCLVMGIVVATCFRFLLLLLWALKVRLQRNYTRNHQKKKV